MADFIEKSSRSKQDIQMDYNDYLALKKRIGKTNSHHYDNDIQRMNKLKDAYLLGRNIITRQTNI